jgi:small subunit ribosomal protein S5
MERYEDHTIAHAIQAKYEKTKVNTWKYRISLIFVNPAVLTLVDLIVYLKIYLWPGPMRSGMSAAGRTVETVLYLAGFSNVKTKV